MLRVTLGLDKVEIRFDHRFCGLDEIKALTGIRVNEDRRCSFVTVSLNGNKVGYGMTICHPTDNFCRAIGRKKALTYALHPLTKELRSAVWEKYKATCRF